MSMNIAIQCQDVDCNISQGWGWSQENVEPSANAWWR